MVSALKFGWDTISRLWIREEERDECGLMPKLKERYIKRDSWTRLNVAPAKIMHVSMTVSFTLSLDISLTHTHTYITQTHNHIPPTHFHLQQDKVISEISRYGFTPGDQMAVEFLTEVNKYFEQGILSREHVASVTLRF